MPTLKFGGTSLHFRERGSGETVLLIHSAGNTGTQWNAIASRLDEEFRLVTPDLYNCGGTSAWTENRPMGFDDEAALLAPLLQRCDVVHLVGHSFGGGVALRLAAAHAAQIRSLSLIEPAAYQVLREVGRDDLWLEFLEVKNRFQADARKGELDRAWQPFFDYYCSHADPWHTLPASVRSSIMQKTTTQLHVYEAQETNPTRLADLRRLSCPTLVIHGELTTAPERGLCEVIAANAPLGYGAEVAGAGHMLPLSHAAMVADLLRAHVQRATAAYGAR
jgi:pimeloyl-ACP methyl ester carboxylesterase